MKLMQAFKGYRSETKSVKPRTTMTTPTTQDSLSLCVIVASQATQKPFETFNSIFTGIWFIHIVLSIQKCL